MKLSDHVEKLRKLIETSFDKTFARLGIGKTKKIQIDNLLEKDRNKRLRFEIMLANHIGETGDYENAREKLIDELTFTLFNRLAALKIMEASMLFPPVLTKQSEHGDRSFGHKAWLELHPAMRSEELEGIREYLKYAFDEIGQKLPLYARSHSYALLPDTFSLNEIIDAFNSVEKDSQVGDNVWLEHDVLGWMYESYNNAKKVEFKKKQKAHKAKVEFNLVSLQSQVYTPSWVVQFLIENSLGKLYLEMFPSSEIRHRYKIVNAPEKQQRKTRPLHSIKVIDPACGSGNFLLYAFDVFYDLYSDQIDHFGAEYDKEDIPRLIIENNLHGIDLDDRAIQLAQLGLFIKANKKQKNIGALDFKIVSSDFFLPAFDEVRDIFVGGAELDEEQLLLISEIWKDLRTAYKFGSLIRLDEKLKSRIRKRQVELETGKFPLFAHASLERETSFASAFFHNLKAAVEKHAKAGGNSFIASKTSDAITFLELLTTVYDLAATNPPYTDTADFGPELKGFIEKNYKKPKFHTNLYASFIKRCEELTTSDGKIAMIHPHTFMFIKSFEDVRKMMIDKTHIDVMVDFGLDRVNLFGPGILLDATFYILSKLDNPQEGLYFNLTTNLQEKFKKPRFFEAVDDVIAERSNDRVYQLAQSKLKIIQGWPLIYWISDDFRAKFKARTIDDTAAVVLGLKTANNPKYLRFFWEVERQTISASLVDGKNWIVYLQGGTFNKWAGNEWLVVEWSNDGEMIRKQKNSQQIEKGLGFKAGITLATRTVKRVCGRVFERNRLFDMAASAIIYNKPDEEWYWAAYSNSKLFNYVLNCLNPTVNKQPEDIRRLPAKLSKVLDSYAETCVRIKESLFQFDLLSLAFEHSPLIAFTEAQDLRSRVKLFLNHENFLLAQALVNEAIINERVFEIYDLTEPDREMVLLKEGESIGSLPLSIEAREAFLSHQTTDVNKSRVSPMHTTLKTDEFRLSQSIIDFIEKLPTNEFSSEEREAIVGEFPALYQSNNDLEEFCIRNQVNPINVWHWFNQSNVIPQQRMKTLAMECLADMIREILFEDEDGIIPLVPNAGEKILVDRIEEKFREKGFSTAQYSNFDSVLGRSLSEYLNSHFFADLSDHLNLFMYLSKTPFIWHLSSGPDQGFGCFILIYKWSRDKLMRLRSVYIEHRERSLVNRQSDLANNESAEAQNERDRIFRQLKEIDQFKANIDSLLSEGYNPVLDDGVGKNVAPLQKKKLLAYEVLNDEQLKRYLNPEW